MLLLRVTIDRGAVTEHLAESFPYRIGRSAAADLRVEAPGVWDQHASIQLGEDGKFSIHAEGESLLLVNSQPSGSVHLRAGDELTVGAARIIVGLAPARQTGLKMAETVVWLLLAAVLLAEIAVIVFAG